MIVEEFDDNSAPLASTKLKNDPQSANNSNMRMITVEFQDSLINYFHPEDILELTGVVKIEASQTASNLRKVKNAGFFDIYMKVNHARRIEKLTRVRMSKALSNHTEQMLKAILHSKLGFYMIIKSFCPEVLGQDLMKGLVILSLVGGSSLEEVFDNTPGRVPEHHSLSNSLHLLLLGERGMGKSKLIRTAARLSSDCKHHIRLNSCPNFP